MPRHPDDPPSLLELAQQQTTPTPPVAQQSTTGTPPQQPRAFFPEDTKAEIEDKRHAEQYGYEVSDVQPPKLSQEGGTLLEKLAARTGFPMQKIRQRKLDGYAGSHNPITNRILLDPGRRSGPTTLSHEVVHALHNKIGEKRTHEIADSLERRFDATILNQSDSKYSRIEEQPFPEDNFDYSKNYHQRPQEKFAFRLDTPLAKEARGQASPQTAKDSLLNRMASAMMNEASFPNTRTPQDTSSIRFDALQQAIQDQVGRP